MGLSNSNWRVTAMNTLTTKYERKRKEFVKQLSTAEESNNLKRMLFDAIIASDVCINTFKDFLQTIATSLSRIQAEKEKNEEDIADLISKIDKRRKQNEQNPGRFDELRHLAKELEEQEKELRKLAENQDLLEFLPNTEDNLDIEGIIYSMEEAQQLSDTLLQTAEDSLNSALLTRQATDKFKVFLHSLSVEEVSDTLEEIFQGRDKEQVIQGATKFGEYIIGLLPVVGPIAATIRFVHDSYQKKVMEIRTTDKTLGYLETFAESAEEWSLTAQIIMDAVSDLSSFEPLPLEESVERHRRRQSLIVQQLQKGLLL